LTAFPVHNILEDNTPVDSSSQPQFHINLDRQPEAVKRFFRDLPIDPAGLVLDLDGEAFLRVLPVADEEIDLVNLQAAILNRRDESRQLNRDWRGVDQASDS
jgi:hypothetical protein